MLTGYFPSQLHQSDSILQNLQLPISLENHSLTDNFQVIILRVVATIIGVWISMVVATTSLTIIPSPFLQRILLGKLRIDVTMKYVIVQTTWLQPTSSAITILSIPQYIYLIKILDLSPIIYFYICKKLITLH